MNFTYKDYSNMLHTLQQKGYSFANYHTCHNHDRCVILRHDIDYSIIKAVELAGIEYSLDVKSNYFVLISSPFYNIISKDVYEKLNLISRWGHDIGLHFDETNYDENYFTNNGGIKSVILREVELLENILGKEVKSISMHRPSTRTLEADYDFGDIANSYGKVFFKDYKYISDSRRTWRENVDEIIKSGKYNKLHILTHAFWYNYQEETIDETVLKFIKSAVEERYDILNDNISNLQEIVDKKKIL